MAVTIVALSITAGVVRADDGEEAVAIKDLPQAIVDALEQAYPDAELLEAEKETEGDKTVYEVELKDGDKTLEVELSSDGEILEVETEDDGEGQDD